jgi:hypothetical protein
MPGPRDRAAHRPQRHREQRETRASSLDRRAHPCSVQSLPPVAGPLRATRRHLRSLHKPRCQPHHTQPDQTVLLGALMRCATPREWPKSSLKCPGWVSSVCSKMPTRRGTSTTEVPVSTCFSAKAICSPANLFFKASLLPLRSHKAANLALRLDRSH